MKDILDIYIYIYLYVCLLVAPIRHKLRVISLFSAAYHTDNCCVFVVAAIEIKTILSSLAGGFTDCPLATPDAKSVSQLVSQFNLSDLCVVMAAAFIDITTAAAITTAKAGAATLTVISKCAQHFTLL